MVKQVGKIFLRPSERRFAIGLSRRTGATISIPGTGEIFDPRGRRFVSRRERELEQHRIKVEKERAQAEANARARALADLERARLEAIRKENERKATAKRELDQALTRARQMQSLSAQARARQIFNQAFKNAEIEKKRTISRDRGKFQGVVARGRVSPITIKKGISISDRLKSIEERFAETNIGKFFDVVSGGTLTERELRRERDKLYADYEKFNNRYGGKELSENIFNIAKREEARLEAEIKRIEKNEEELRNSTKRWIGNYIWRAGALTGGRDLSDPQVISDFLKMEEKNLEGINKKLKDGGMSKTKTNLYLKLQESSSKTISDLRAGNPPRILMGEPPPLIPAGVFRIPKNVKVSFIGTQKMKGNKIITDVIFKVGGKRVGIARGVTIVRGRGGVSVVFGKSGVVGVGFPLGKFKIGRVQKFVGVEKAISKPAIFKILKTIKISGKSINVIRRNLQGFKQAGIGRVITKAGKRVFKMGSKSVQVDDFASISAILSKKDLSLIVGKAITFKDSKIKFIGLIKGLSGDGKFVLTNIQRAQYKVALQKVLSAVASAQAKSKTISGLTTAQRLGASVSIIKSTTRTGKAPTITQITEPKAKVVSTLSSPQRSKAKTKVKQKVTQLSKESQKTKQRLRQLAKQKPKTKTAQKTLQQQRQRLRLRLKTLTKQKQKLVRIKITPTFIPTPSQLRFFGIAFPKRKKKVIKLKSKKKKARSYDVYARPVKKKGKKKPKLIKVTKRPIKKKRAKDLRNYLVDTSLSRTGRIKPSSKKPSKRKLKAPSGYAKKTKKKFRKYKIRKGKRKPLRKGKVIERKRYIQDTLQEKQKLTLKRRIAQLKKQARKPVRRTPTRRAPARSKMRRVVRSPQSRKTMLRNLTKARRVRMQNLKMGRAPVRRSPARSPVRKSVKNFNRNFNINRNFNRKNVKKPVRRAPARSPTPQQLRNLAKGRAKLKKMRGG